MRKMFKSLLLLFILSNVNVKALTDLKSLDIFDSNFLLLTETEENVKSTDNTLKTLKIDDKLIDKFNPNTLIYNLSFDKTKTSINIEVEANDKEAYVSGDIGRKSLKYGLNTFKIYVRSEAGERREYIINVTRVDNRENVNTLKKLTLSAGEITFDSQITEYMIMLDKSVEKVTIDSTLTSNKATYAKGYGNREVSLKEGMNQVLIKVKAENDEEKVYTLNIIRGEYSFEDAKNVNIKTLKIDGYNLNYSNDVLEYNLKIKDEKKLNITVELENEKATSQILNNWNLSAGSVITIKVISEDKTEVKEVSITIEKEKVESSTLREERTIKDTIIEVLCFSVFIVGMVLFILAIRRYNKK